MFSSRNFVRQLITNYYLSGEKLEEQTALDFQMILQATDNSVAGAIYSYDCTNIVYKTNNETLPGNVTLPQNLFPLENTVANSTIYNVLMSGEQIIRGPSVVDGTSYLSITVLFGLQNAGAYGIPSFGFLTMVTKGSSLLNVVRTNDLTDGSHMLLIKLNTNSTRSSSLQNIEENRDPTVTFNVLNFICSGECRNTSFPLRPGTPEYLALVNRTSGARINYDFYGNGYALSAGYAPVSTFSQIWAVIVMQPHSYVYGPIRTIQNISITAVFSIGAGVCIVTLLLSGWVLRPITRLQEATEQSYRDTSKSKSIWHLFKNLLFKSTPKKSKPNEDQGPHDSYNENNGQLTRFNESGFERYNIPMASLTRERLGHFQDEKSEFRLPDQVVTRKYIKDELTELTETFNEMTKELRKQYSKLEDRVQQRSKEIKSAKLLAETANEAKSLFIANITHELRTPLNGILGMAAVAMEDDDPQSIKDSLKVIFKSGELLLRLLTDLLSFSRSEVDNMKLEIKGFSISEVISQLHAIFDENSKTAKINFSIILTDEWLTSYELYGDINRILQVVINLVSNSLKFTPPGGFVKVIISSDFVKNVQYNDDASIDDSNKNKNNAYETRLTRNSRIEEVDEEAEEEEEEKKSQQEKDDGSIDQQSDSQNKASEANDSLEKVETNKDTKDQEDMLDDTGTSIVSFRVCDSGTGIPPHLQARVFEPFVQGDIGARETRSGAGLGLSICKHLATLMDGTINLQSEVGRGSCFTFLVPLRCTLETLKGDNDDSSTSSSSDSDSEHYLELKSEGLQKLSIESTIIEHSAQPTSRKETGPLSNQDINHHQRSKSSHSNHSTGSHVWTKVKSMILEPDFSKSNQNSSKSDSLTSNDPSNSFSTIGSVASTNTSNQTSYSSFNKNEQSNSGSVFSNYTRRRALPQLSIDIRNSNHAHYNKTASTTSTTTNSGTVSSNSETGINNPTTQKDNKSGSSTPHSNNNPFFFGITPSKSKSGSTGTNAKEQNSQSGTSRKSSSGPQTQGGNATQKSSDSPLHPSSVNSDPNNLSKSESDDKANIPKSSDIAPEHLEHKGSDKEIKAKCPTTNTGNNASTAGICSSSFKIDGNGHSASTTSISGTVSASSKKTVLDPKICDDLCILVAEDNRVNQEVMIKMLHLESIRNVQVANDGIEAVKAVKRSQELPEQQGHRVSSSTSSISTTTGDTKEKPNSTGSTISHDSLAFDSSITTTMAPPPPIIIPRSNTGKSSRTSGQSWLGNKFVSPPGKHFDIIFMDIQMPNLDGIQATKQIRQDLNYKGPIIAVSAFTDKSNVDKCLQAGIDDFLGKPLRRPKLHALLIELVEKRKEKK